MPLYSNILLSNQETGTKDPGKSQDSQRQAPTASLKLLQDHLRSKKRAKQASIQPNKLQKVTDKTQLAANDSPRQLTGWNPQDEYDPMMPNSYELLQLEHIKAEEQRLAARRSGNRIDLSLLDALERLDDDDKNLESKGRPSQGTAIAPPPTLQASNRPTVIVSTSDHVKASALASQAPTDKLDGKSAAAKIMAKMGYKSGEGLGRDKQGISTPLEVQTTGTTGRIVQKQQSPPTTPHRPVEPKATRILLLQNMVGPGEVDDDLEAETKEECMKYGPVIKCLIYEIPGKQVPADEAVRIFVEFQDIESTRKAISDLNGRYFGGRVVKATFYDENKFNRYELAP